MGQLTCVRSVVVLGVILAGVAVAYAQPAPNAKTHPTAATEPETLADGTVVSRHTISLAGKELNYEAATGLFPIADDAGKTIATIFFTAYVKQDAAAGPNGRPITFAFNGGPGAASLWLHMGSLGPQRVVLPEGGTVLPKAVETADNQSTWLDFTDLVFIDPVGSGFSTAAPGIDASRFFGMDEDVRSVGEFIRAYVAKHGRWRSPKFLAGESYGTTRAAGLTRFLQDHVGMGLDGVIMISSALNFQTLRFAPGNDLPYQLYLPSYTATALYHKRLAADLQKDPDKTLAAAERWATTDYAAALARGDELSSDERKKIVDGLARYTGLPARAVERSDLRIDNRYFAKQLLLDQQPARVIGQFDARVTGTPTDPQSNDLDYDPSMVVIVLPFVAAMQDYLYRDLGFKTQLKYDFLSGRVSQAWNWGSSARGYPNVTDQLQTALCKNEHLRVFAAMGTYDLVTGYFAQRYMYNHLGIPPEAKSRVTQMAYPSGHQIYNHAPSLEKLHDDIRKFVEAGK